MAARMLPFASVLSVALGAKAPKQPVELVLARLEGDVAWVSAHKANATVTIYNQGAALEQTSGVNVVDLPAAGNEARAFLHHIVHHYDHLAEKVVFMPGQKPSTGFQGFRHGSAQMLPGVEVKDYVSKASPPLFVPTMAFTSNLQQVSVRTAYMEGQPEAEGERFSVCSTEGNAGWSPFMPNTYASSVLEPLMAKQKADGEVLGFEDFWAKHLPETEIPEVLRVAHGSIFSVDRKAILDRPKSFYENLLADVSDETRAHLALFVESMWWYLFHEDKDQICPKDLSTAASAASSRRRLAAAIMLLHPKAGDKFKFGQVMKIDWSTVYTANTVPFRVEIWKFGTFHTRIESSTYNSYLEWMVTPDAADLEWRTNKPTDGEKHTRAYTLTPGDDYTIRVCDGSVDSTQPFDEQICDDTYGESAEFTFEPTITMLKPACGEVITAPTDIQVVWSSYYVPTAAGLTVGLFTGDYFQLWSETIANDTGYYTFYAPSDMPSGTYRFKVTAACSSCATSSADSDKFMIGDYASIEAVGCSFTLANSPPPPAPPPSNVPPTPWEIPIIKAFESGYGGSVYTPNTDSNSFILGESTASCEQVCMLGYGRKLLFGGLGYLKSGVSCSQKQVDCGCSFCSR